MLSDFDVIYLPRRSGLATSSPSTENALSIVNKLHSLPHKAGSLHEADFGVHTAWVQVDEMQGVSKLFCWWFSLLTMLLAFGRFSVYRTLLEHLALTTLS